jgi:hypothetical protein
MGRQEIARGETLGRSRGDAQAAEAAQVDAAIRLDDRRAIFVADPLVERGAGRGERREGVVVAPAGRAPLNAWPKRRSACRPRSSRYRRRS